MSLAELLFFWYLCIILYNVDAQFTNVGNSNHLLKGVLSTRGKSAPAFAIFRAYL
jgi:hypothetical protein